MRGVVGTVVPSWMLDFLMPLLDADEWRLHCYIMRRTWGLRRPEARISIAQMASGMVVRGVRMDGGAGMTEKSIRRSIKLLREARIIVEVRPPSSPNKLGPLLRPGWSHEIDWKLLKANRLERRAQSLAKLSLEAFDLLPDMSPELAKEIEQDYAEFISTWARDETDVDIEWIIEEPEIAPPDAPVVEAPKVRTAKDQRLLATPKPKPPAAPQREAKPNEYLPGLPDPRSRRNEPAWIASAGRLGVSKQEAVAIAQKLLDMVGMSVLADQETDYGDYALNEAHMAAITIMGIGYHTVESMSSLETAWDNYFIVKRALEAGGEKPLPTYKQLVNLAPSALKKGKQQQRKGEPALPKITVTPLSTARLNAYPTSSNGNGIFDDD